MSAIGTLSKVHRVWSGSVGNRVSLSISACCEFEANNCIPVTWLALFGPNDLTVDTRCDGPEKYDAVVYKTSQSVAFQRVEQAISKLRGRTPAWKYLRPLEVLRDELKRCSVNSSVELDATQFWAMNETFRQLVVHGPVAIATMIDAMTGEKQHDMAVLNTLVNDFNVVRISSVANLNPEERMFTLIGMYWGEREDQYSLEYFGEAYWMSTE